MKRIMLLLSFISAFGGTCIAQGWRGIEPLRSTCDDVKQVLKIDKCEYPKSRYDFQDETVTISFVTCPCPIVCSQAYGGWNVPSGTVTGIIREIHKPIPAAEFDVDSEKWSKTETDMIGQILYDDHEAGVTLSAIDGKVIRVTYYAPLEKNRHLLCPRCSTQSSNSKTDDEGSSWLSGYGDLSFEEEKKHLDKFAIKLREHISDSIGYVVVYGGCRSRSDEVQRRAELAKKYLVERYAIPSKQIVIIEGGQHESFEIEMYVRSRSLPPPQTSSSKYPAN